ncbi:MAG TPA: hypothetical protein DEO84_07965 [candidate division Zixibacteria bacterium]|nr:hypothetical protein [candidate division Zixibacteria bacterium]
MKKVLLVVGTLAVMISCQGKQGPVGPQGLQGEPGPGTRTVYLSTTPIPTDLDYYVSIPAIHLSDMPLVSVYISPPSMDLWIELPVYYEGAPGVGRACGFTEGNVLFEGCNGYNYKIVIVE